MLSQERHSGKRLEIPSLSQARHSFLSRVNQAQLAVVRSEPLVFAPDILTGGGGARTEDAATRARARQTGLDGRLKQDRGWHPEQLYVQDATRNSI